MKEALLHYAWQYRLFYANNLKTTAGDDLEIVDPGKPNTDAGPDFFNAKIKIGGTLWVGNVEIHTHASDWEKHGHQVNKKYDSVILHVVKHADYTAKRTTGEAIPLLVLPYFSSLESSFEELMRAKGFVACAGKLKTVEPIILQTWKNRLLTERLEQKVIAITESLHLYNNDWEEVFYITLVKYLGTGVNGTPFELLAKSLPQRYLAKHKDNVSQLEALLFGQSGLLELAGHDEYAETLQKEYAFLRTKYALTPVDGTLWKLLRLRPVNFPHVRIAQLAALTHRSSKLFSKIIEAASIHDLTALFQSNPSDYWDTHYTFGKLSAQRQKTMGKSTVEMLLINVVVPFLFAYGKHRDDEALQERALQLLVQIPAENNHIITGWKSLGIDIKSAFDSQAFIQLKKNYCDDKKCLYCSIGHQILAL